MSEIINPHDWMGIAKGEMGIKEIPGSKENPRIIEYHSKTSGAFSSDEVPWCSSFVNWVLNTAGYNTTRSAMARSWLSWGVPLQKPKFGCVVVLTRGKSKTSGHVGFFIKKNMFTIELLGGNQSNQVKISKYYTWQVLGYRYPTEKDRLKSPMKLP